MSNDLETKIVIKADGRQASKIFGRLTGLGNRLGSSLFNLKTAFIALSGAFVLGSFIRVSAAFEKLDIQLTSLQGSALAGKKATEWIKAFAQEVPLGIQEVTRSFVMARAFGLDPMDGTMQKIVDTSEKLGGGIERLTSITRAIGQMWTKTKIQAQEMNLQLTEQGVPAWDLLSKAMGLSIPVLQKMSEKGELGRDVIKLLIDEMGRFGAGAAKANMTTYLGLWSNFIDQISLGRDEFTRADRGLFNFVKGGLAAGIAKLTEFRTSGQLDKWGQGVGDTMLRAVESVLLGTAVITSALQPIFDVVFKGINSAMALFNSMPDWAKPLGLIGAIMLGPKGIALGVLILGIVDPIAAGVKRVIRTFKGELGSAFDPKPVQQTNFALMDLANSNQGPYSTLAKTLLEIRKHFEAINNQKPIDPPKIANAGNSTTPGAIGNLPSPSINLPSDPTAGFGDNLSNLNSQQATVAGQVLDTNQQLTQSYRDQFTSLQAVTGALGPSIARYEQQNRVMQFGQQLQQGVNGALQQYILGQSKLGPALKAATAQALASVAARAAVEALYMTGVGLAALTPWGAALYGPASNWFIGAATMAAVAGVTGIAARGLSGGTSASRAPVPVTNSPGTVSTGAINNQNQGGTQITLIIENRALNPEATDWSLVAENIAEALGDKIQNSNGQLGNVQIQFART